MIKRLLSTLLILCMVLGVMPVSAHAAESTAYVDENGHLQTVETVSITTGDTALSSGWYVVDQDVTIDTRLEVSGNVNLILTDGYTLAASQGILVPTSASLTIYGQTGQSGKLKATGKIYCAGIGGVGGTNKEVNGAITINGGEVTAIGGQNAAGIGGSTGGDGCNITINNGTVTSTGGNGAAGIGGTENHVGSNIIISGGTVTANGGNYGAGIGGGRGYDSTGASTNIKISGGTVLATAGSGGGAGIGGGGGAAGGSSNIVISGGTVTATGGSGGGTSSGGGAGIGSGFKGAAKDIIISGGSVAATGGIGGESAGAGIGGGNLGSSSGIQFSGGVTVANSEKVAIDSTPIFDAAYIHRTYGNAQNAESAETVESTSAPQEDWSGWKWVKIQPTSGYTVSFDANGGTVSPTRKTVINGQPYGDLPTVTRSNYRFEGWFTSASGGTQITSGTTVNLTADQTLYAHWIADPAQKAWQYFSFSNSTSDFFRSGETNNYNAGRYFDNFSNVLTRYYQSSSASYYLNRLRSKQSSSWSGSCYGFASLEGMVNHNLLAPGAIDSDAGSLPSVDKPREDTGVRNLLNYYYLTQFIPAMRSKQYNIGTSASTQALSKMVSDVIGGTPYMFSYFFDGGGHAIILEGGKQVADGSYELVGQDNRFHGYTICEKTGNGWTDTREPVTVTIKISGNYSSCNVLLSPNTHFTRDGSVYRSNINEAVYAFEPVSMFSHFASADPTGTAVHAQLYSEATDSPSVFYYDPEGEDVASFTLEYGGVSIESGAMANSEHVEDFWYTIGGATNTVIAGADGIANLETQNAPSGIMAVLDTNPNEEYTISNMGSGTFSYAGADGFSSVSVTDAESAIIDLKNDAVILTGNKGDFNIAVSDENRTVTTVSGSVNDGDIQVSSSANGIELTAPTGSYTVTFAEANGQETTSSVVSRGEQIHVEAPVSGPVVCGKYVSDFTAEISRSGSGFTFTLTSRGAAPVPKTVTAWQATYDENNKMVKMNQLSSEQTGNSMRFSGTVSDEGKCKLFVLDETFTPIIEKYSLN